MSFRPQFWPTLTTALMLIALLGLGTWQVQRHGWKSDLIEKLHSRSEAAAVELPDGPSAPDVFEFQRVRLTGTFLHDQEFHLIGRSLRGNPGVHVLTPLRRADGKGYAIVDRGWVPFDRRAPENRAAGQIQGEVTFEGIVRLAKGPGIFTPENDPKGNNWYFVEPKLMARIAGLDALPDYYVLSGAKNIPGGYPVTKQWRLDIRNNHAEYAITWYLMAVVLIVIYIVYHRQKT
ncbi:MAG: SURF1 family protein [Alphaproteobacteria bacterium]|nr:SURF1 family protein [Alphaproteobacteria bacterium]